MTVNITGGHYVGPDRIEIYGGTGTIDGLSGGFTETIDVFRMSRNGYTSNLTLTGGDDGVNITVQQPGVQGDSGRIGIANYFGANSYLRVDNGAELHSINNAVYDASVGYVRGGYSNIRIGGDGGIGTVVVDGEGSVMDASGVAPRIDIGRTNGNGTLTLQNGGDAGSLSVMVGRGGTGTLNVDGAGSVLTIGDQFGQYGMDSGTDYSEAGGGLTIGRSQRSNGQDSQSNGYLNVTDGGVINIENTAGLTYGAFLNVGRGKNGNGDILVTGLGSQINIIENNSGDGANREAFAFLGIGRSGQGDVTIEQGGEINLIGFDANVRLGDDSSGEAMSSEQSTLTIQSGGKLTIDSGTSADAAGMQIGRDDGSNAAVTVDGEGSLLLINSDKTDQTNMDFGPYFIVGRGGDGDLTVRNGGDVLIDGSGSLYPIFYIGRGENDGSADGKGTVVIEGVGSTIKLQGFNPTAQGSEGFVSVGRNANAEGALFVRDGGFFDAAGAMEIAGNAGTRGVVIVDGPASEVDAGDYLAVGADNVNTDINPEIGGDASLTISDGGTVRAGQIFFGRSAKADLDGYLIGETEFYGSLEIGEGRAGVLGHEGAFSFESGATWAIDITDFGNNVGDKIEISGDAVFNTRQSFFGIDLNDADIITTGQIYTLATATGTLTADTRTVYDLDRGLEFELSVSGSDLILTAQESSSPNSLPVPVVRASDVTRDLEQWTQLGDVIDIETAEGQLIEKFEIYDNVGSDNFYVSGQGMVDASRGFETENLFDIWFQGDASASSQTLWVRGYDGTQWSAWDRFEMESRANEAATVTIADQTVTPGQWTRLNSVINITDTDGDSATKYQLWDSTGNNNWWADGGYVDAQNGYETSNLAGAWFQGDSAGGDQTLWVRTYDGVEWGAWESFVLDSGPVLNTAPSVAIDDLTVATGQWTRLSDVLQFTDAESSSAASYELWDSSSDANWWAGGDYVDASRGYETTTALSRIWVQGDSEASTQTLWVRANDGEQWSEWDSFDLITT